MLAVYAIVNGNESGWTSGQTLGLLAGAVVLIVAFLVREARIASPLVPLGLFRNRNVSVANGTGILMAGGLFAYFFVGPVHAVRPRLHAARGGLRHLPSIVVWGATSLYSDKLVMRFGIKPPLVVGLRLMTLSLLLFARAPVDGNFVVDILRPRSPSASAPASGSTRSCSRPWEAWRRRGGARVGRRQHVVHDGGARPRRAGEPRGRSDGQSDRVGRGFARRPEQRIPRRVPRRGGLRGAAAVLAGVLSGDRAGAARGGRARNGGCVAALRPGKLTE